MARDDGDFAAARRYTVDALRLRVETGQTKHIVAALRQLAEFVLQSGDAAGALQATHVARATWDRTAGHAGQVPPSWLDDIERAALNALDPAEATISRTAARSMSLDQFIAAMASAGGVQAAPHGPAT